MLRPFELSDAPRVKLLAGDREIAATTARIPHPYEPGMAEAWIGTHQEDFEKGTAVNFAITLKDTSELMGAIGLIVNRDHENAEMGYWIGKPYWNRGYCTEAARAVLQYAFDELRLNRVFAHHFSHNIASGRVMQKLGMRHEGRRRQHVKKWGQFIDSEMYGILRNEFDSAGRPGS
ncbi:MAG TPA: GNAT family N-acetyltransferase [Verrucomicrobiae bacterium]|nr:GNAT family N-acetyltransferase [Verrucomicrobiae bacterium]